MDDGKHRCQSHCSCISGEPITTKMNYEDFCHIASVCTQQIAPKCRWFFSPSNLMQFEKDEQGRIAILPFYLYVMHTSYSTKLSEKEGRKLFQQLIDAVEYYQCKRVYDRDLKP